MKSPSRLALFDYDYPLNACEGSQQDEAVKCSSDRPPEFAGKLGQKFGYGYDINSLRPK